MNSRERLIATINHREPDRVPFDLGATFTSGIHVAAYQRLCERLGLPPQDTAFHCLDEQIVLVDEALRVRLKIDTEPVLPGAPSGEDGSIEDRGDCLYFKNEWQMGLKMPKPDGFYYDVFEHPLADASIDDLSHFDWPDARDAGRFSDLELKVQRAAATGRGVIMNNVAAGLLELSGWLLGYERLFSSMLLEPDFIEALFDKIMAFKLAYWGIVLESVGDQIDVVLESDDLGEQRQPLISPRLYRKMLKPRHKELFDYIHANTNAKLFLHSCGMIYPLIPDLIEIGVDILNPVQVNVPNMDSAKLKAEFGREMVFWGGALDPQGIFSSATPQQVRDETRRNIENLAPGGGFVFAAVHNIQPDVPVENIMAMWDALQEYGIYH